MNEKKEASGKPENSILSKIKTFCKRRKYICHVLLYTLLILPLYHFFYLVYTRMSWERTKLVWAILTIVIILYTIFAYRCEKKRKRALCE